MTTETRNRKGNCAARRVHCPNAVVISKHRELGQFVCGMTKEIALTQSKIALVDDDDFQSINQFKWYAVKMKDGTFYARSWMAGQEIYLHNFIMQPPVGMEIDHIDRDSLNCTQGNMRLATHAQNCLNKRKRMNMTSQYRGVSFDQSCCKWRAQISINGKNRRIGLFDDEIDAARDYDEIAKKPAPFGHGEFSQFNFPG